MKSEKKIELLAPAGSPACALAAFDAGADAIYCGLSKFNARERGENFSDEDMARVVAFAHKINRKVYITLNTLIKENELPQIMEMLAKLYDMKVDGLIVQDLGVLRLAREYFPKFELHGSTQMGIHNSAGVANAEKLGMHRVILERQITMDELKAIAAQSKIELEVFIHGALCCSLSGECLFSSWLGGHSGNRGRCKQPCRRRFYSNKGNGFFFSPQDLCTLDMIPEFKAMGIASLKIEGRLRQADYVYNTVSAYRMVLDAPQVTPEILGEARRLLSKSCGRKWSHGFLSEKSMDSLILHENLGSAGMLCGEIKGVADNGFSFVTKKSLHVGDRMRIQPSSGDDGPAMTLTKMFVNNQDVKKAKVGDEVFVCYDREVPFRGIIYKIGESFRDYSGRLAGLENPKKSLDLQIKITADKLAVSIPNLLQEFSFETELQLAGALKHPLNAEKIMDEFKQADSEILSTDRIEVEIDGDYFMPAQILKEVRRNFWEKVKAELNCALLLNRSADALGRFVMDYKQIQPQYPENRINLETIAVKVDGETPGNPNAVKAISIFDFNKRTTQVILPEFTPEGRLGTLKKAIAAAYSQGIRSFRIGSLFEFELLREYTDIEIIAGDPLPICNSMAVMELKHLNAVKVQAHFELDKTALENLRDHSPLVLEIYRFGRPPLLVSRAKIPAEGLIKDARTNEFIVRYDGKSKLTRVYPQEIFSIPRLPNTFDFYDLRNADWKNPNTSTFNFNLELQ